MKLNDRFTAGLPDIIGCFEGQMFAIELKAGRNRTTKLQESVLEHLRASGAKTLVAYNVEQVEHFVLELQIMHTRRFLNGLTVTNNFQG